MFKINKNTKRNKEKIPPPAVGAHVPFITEPNAYLWKEYLVREGRFFVFFVL
jgi:hypothetical protein